MFLSLDLWRVGNRRDGRGDEKRHACIDERWVSSTPFRRREKRVSSISSCTQTTQPAGQAISPGSTQLTIESPLSLFHIQTHIQNPSSIEDNLRTTTSKSRSAGIIKFHFPFSSRPQIHPTLSDSGSIEDGPCHISGSG